MKTGIQEKKKNVEAKHIKRREGVPKRKLFLLFAHLFLIQAL